MVLTRTSHQRTSPPACASRKATFPDKDLPSGDVAMMPCTVDVAAGATRAEEEKDDAGADGPKRATGDSESAIARAEAAPSLEDIMCSNERRR